MFAICDLLGSALPVGWADRKKVFGKEGLLGACYWFDVYGAAAAAVSMLSSSQCSSVEACFEFLAVLLFPLGHRDSVFLLYPVPVPFGDDVERAEGYDSHVWC